MSPATQPCGFKGYENKKGYCTLSGKPEPEQQNFLEPISSNTHPSAAKRTHNTQITNLSGGILRKMKVTIPQNSV